MLEISEMPIFTYSDFRRLEWGRIDTGGIACHPSRIRTILRVSLTSISLATRYSAATFFVRQALRGNTCCNQSLQWYTPMVNGPEDTDKNTFQETPAISVSCQVTTAA